MTGNSFAQVESPGQKRHRCDVTFRAHSVTCDVALPSCLNSVILIDGRCQFPKSRKTLKSQVSQSSGIPQEENRATPQNHSELVPLLILIRRNIKKPRDSGANAPYLTARASRFENPAVDKSSDDPPSRDDRVEKIENIWATEMKSLTVRCLERRMEGPPRHSFR
jgi:hypothetical protein